MVVSINGKYDRSGLQRCQMPIVRPHRPLLGVQIHQAFGLFCADGGILNGQAYAMSAAFGKHFAHNISTITAAVTPVA